MFLENKNKISQSEQKAALGKLLDRYRNSAFAIALKYVHNKNDAEDIVQNSFIKVFLHIDQFKSDSTFSTWLYKIVYNESIRFLSNLKNNEPVSESTNNIADDEGNEVIDDWDLYKLKLSFKVLSSNEYLVIQLFYYEEKSIKEVSQIMNLSSANIKVLLHRARNKITTFLNKKVSNE